jgi:hypothetical protein
MAFELDPHVRKKIEKRRREERGLRIWRRRQVRKWLRIFRTHGLDALCELRYQGRVPRLNDAQCDELKQEIAKGQFRTARQITEERPVRTEDHPPHEDQH